LQPNAKINDSLRTGRFNTKSRGEWRVDLNERNFIRNAPAIVNVMALVSVKSKFQVVIPQDVREAVGIEVGDLLEAKVEAGKITFHAEASS
jgi:AbrB family looped-hinge helix DNA binding protein